MAKRQKRSASTLPDVAAANKESGDVYVLSLKNGLRNCRTASKLVSILCECYADIGINWDTSFYTDVGIKFYADVGIKFYADVIIRVSCMQQHVRDRD